MTNVGVAAHITAASPGGPRYNASLTVEARRADGNAIWLCQRCAKAVDDDSVTYSEETLRAWKRQAETDARRAIESGPKQPEQHINAAVYLGPNAINIGGPVVAAARALSPDARELLCAAAGDQHGAILVGSTFDGMFVQTGERDYCKGNNPRSEARWRSVISELMREGLIAQTGREIYSVTNRGYEYVERGGT